ncbi:hypothetical protein VTH82DRAFT_5517 [Thermothelomyces myriococcoides]
MDSVTPIPVAIFGKDPKIARIVSEKLLPDFDTVHVCLDLPSALAELPALFSPSGPPPPAPASGLGANAYTPDPAKRRAKVPRAVFFGGGFTDDEYNAVVDAVQKVTTTTAAAATANAGEERGGIDSVKRQHQQQHHQQQQQQQMQQVVHFIKVQKRDVLAAGGLGPNPDVICRVFRKKMAAALDRDRDRAGEQQQQRRLVRRHMSGS